VRYFCLLASLLFLPGPLLSQSSTQAQQNPPTATVNAAAPAGALHPEEIIRRFAAKETEFYEAWMQYTYHQVAEVQVLSVNGVPKHEKMTTTSDIVFNDNGSRDIQISRRAGNIWSVTYTQEDEEVINNLHPFALTEKELPEYDVHYEGKEKVDELKCYVFSVTPKNLKGKKLYFEGKIWVDDQDLQIVRTIGKPVPQRGGNRFPEFETIRQMIDKKYWFPVWTHADTVLKFSSDEQVRFEETITYTDYKQFSSKYKIISATPEENP
jgi:hypothetical protein